VSAAQKIVPDKLNLKARHVRPGLFEDHFEVSMHGVDNQISATQQKDGNANEQENWHVTLRGCSRWLDNAQI
jgi:hypothetical protein